MEPITLPAGTSTPVRYQDGQDRYTTEIIADRMQMLGGKGQASQDASEPAAEKPAKAPSKFDDLEDDIPF